MTSKVYDPMKYVMQLNQALAGDRIPLGFLLGAGCPLSIRVPDGASSTKPLLPDIAGLTRIIDATLPLVAGCDSSLKAVKEQLQHDGLPSPTVEDYLNHVRGLRRVVGNDTVRGLDAKQLDDLDRAICDKVSNSVEASLPKERTAYHKLAAWVGSVLRHEPVELFTTNYDLLLEQALESQRVPYFDGFVGSARPFLDLRAVEDEALPPRWARVWKIHGSVNWSQGPDGIVTRTAPSSPSERRLIHPSHLKYQDSRRMPYLVMIDRLRSFLKRPYALLLVTGFSFRDEHLNEAIIQGLEANSSAAAFALLYGDLATYEEARRIAQWRPNMTVLARDAGVVATNEGHWCEKSATTIDSETLGATAIDWVDNIPGPTKTAQFRLGDFSRLGQFIEYVLGGGYRMPANSTVTA